MAGPGEPRVVPRGRQSVPKESQGVLGDPKDVHGNALETSRSSPEIPGGTPREPRRNFIEIGVKMVRPTIDVFIPHGNGNAYSTNAVK